MLCLKAVAITLAWLAMHGAWAQSIEPAQQHLVLGQTPVLRLHVRGFEIDPAQVRSTCIQVVLSQGGTDIPDETIEVRTRPLADDGKVLVQISSSVEVIEPVLHARVTLTCGADFAREFSLLADPPGEPRVASHTSAGNAARPAQAAAPVKAMTRERRSPALATVGDVDPKPLRHPGPADTGARLQLEDPAIDRVVEAVLLALAQRPAGPDRNTTASRDMGLRPIEADWLRELQTLQEEQRQARAQVAALQLRLERQESDTLQRWGAIVATAVGLVAAALLLRLARERVLPRLAGALGHRGEVEPPTAVPPHPGDATGASRTGISRDDPPARGASSATRMAHSDASGRHAPPVPWSDDSSPRTDPLREDASLPRQWAHADFGEPSLDGVAHAPWLQQVDQMSDGGYHGASVTVLESALQAHRGKNPWLLVRLLDLYRAMDQPWNHERVSAQVEALYNVRVPPMQSGHHPPDEGRTLESDASLLDRIVDLWPRPDATLELLDACLLRERGQPARDLGEFRDLLMLYAIARQHTQPDEAATA